MKKFLFINSKRFLEEFEDLRAAILSKAADKLTYAIHLLISELQNKNSIIDLALKYPNYVSSSIEEWETEYEIAEKVLQHELAAQSGTYLFEVVTYLFSYFMNLRELRPLFFLTHGIPIKDTEIDIGEIRRVTGSSYPIYSLEEDQFESYALTKSDFEKAFKIQSRISDFAMEITGDEVVILQIQKTY